MAAAPSSLRGVGTARLLVHVPGPPGAAATGGGLGDGAGLATTAGLAAGAGLAGEAGAGEGAGLAAAGAGLATAGLAAAAGALGGFGAVVGAAVGAALGPPQATRNSGSRRSRSRRVIDQLLARTAHSDPTERRQQPRRRTGRGDQNQPRFVLLAAALVAVADHLPGTLSPRAPDARAATSISVASSVSKVNQSPSLSKTLRPLLSSFGTR
jgi:hypothetical protein